jgi:excisionase family DNA binding protein
MLDDLTVAEAAEALGTSKQTVRTLLRTGELQGRREPWGRRYVWVLSRKGVDDFLSQNGRLDGRRRQQTRTVQTLDDTATAVTLSTIGQAPPVGSPDAATLPPHDHQAGGWNQPAPDTRPFLLRARGRATAFLAVVGLPLVLVYVAGYFFTGALWFDEVGQLSVFGRTIAAKTELYLLAGGIAAFVIGANLTAAVSRSRILWTRGTAATVAAVSLVAGSYFASAGSSHWQAFVLWQHRQSFGVEEPLHGKDVGFFVFTLPFERVVVDYLFLVVAAATASAVCVYWERGLIGIRPLRLSHETHVHATVLGAAFLLIFAWKLHLERYALELGQPSPGDDHSFAGANYVDAHVRSPGLEALSIFAVLLAVLCVAAPSAARTWFGRRPMFVGGTLIFLLALGVILVTVWLPALVQRYAVDPNPLLSERPFLTASIAATRNGMALDETEVEPYSPSGTFAPADISGIRKRLAHVAIWDPSLLKQRMRQLVTETPYYEPEEPTYDVVQVDGHPQLTVTSARELNIRRLRSAGTWGNNRLTYTHGVGLARFSAIAVQPDRQPRLLDSGLGIRQPRIYYGDLPPHSPSWVVADTRRPEVDVPDSQEATESRYHYAGGGGISLASWINRAAFALELGSKALLLSDDITSESRLLLHRDLGDRLHTLAPFIQWDSHPSPLALDGRIVFLVQGYTTSGSYPYSQRVDLEGASVNYARASVLATVDAYAGHVDLYLTDEADPIARAWSEIFPTLFRTEEEFPAELRRHLRYPADLFAAQATAYERFHATQPDRFASGSDVWSRPISLSGSLEVAGDVDFDESDEDDLRATMKPGYKFSPPPGEEKPVLLLETYYSPRHGQNLVGTLSGWLDNDGRPHLASRRLPRDPVSLGPAQISRLVFATPRVRNLLGLRNLEIRDVDKSSLDAVILGNPHLLLLPGGVVQIQSLYEGSRGPGAARLLGVTAFLNGRAGLGQNIESAVRQALNKPPDVNARKPSGPTFVGEPVALRFDVANGQSEVITVTSSAGRQTVNLSLTDGRGTAVWYPSAPGQVEVRVEVEGLDGTVVADSTSFRVFSPPPTVRLLNAPSAATVGRPIRISFEVANGLSESVQIATSGGEEVARRYFIRQGVGFVDWTPESAGKATLLIRVRGRQGQSARERLRIDVVRQPRSGSTASSAVLPDSVSAPIGHSMTALSKAASLIAAHSYVRGSKSLKLLLRNVVRANRAATGQVGLPPIDAESDEPPGPACVFAVLNLDHLVTMRLVPLFDRLANTRATESLRHTLSRTYDARDTMLDEVIALPHEGARADYDDGMADTLGGYSAEQSLITTALLTYELADPARTALTNALARVQATAIRVSAVWGGGE